MARIDQAGTTAGAEGKVVHDKSKQTGSRSRPTSGRTDAPRTGNVSDADQPPASTKRAKLIMMLKRPEGASVAEIGQQLGWLPHTVRAAITGLRQAGRVVTRSKDTDDRSVYRIATSNLPAKVAEIAERFFFGLKARIEMVPVMAPEDLKIGLSGMQGIIQRYG